MSAEPDPKRQMLRHTLATLAYRGGKALRGAPAGFAAFRAGEASRTAGEILVPCEVRTTSRRRSRPGGWGRSKRRRGSNSIEAATLPVEEPAEERQIRPSPTLRRPVAAISSSLKTTSSKGCLAEEVCPGTGRATGE